MMSAAQRACWDAAELIQRGSFDGGIFAVAHVSPDKGTARKAIYLVCRVLGIEEGILGFMIWNFGKTQAQRIDILVIASQWED